MDAISNRSLKAHVGALAVSLVMATAIATPALAFANGTTSQSTDVTIQSVTPRTRRRQPVLLGADADSLCRQGRRHDAGSFCEDPADSEQVGIPDSRGKHGRHRAVAVQARC